MSISCSVYLVFGVAYPAGATPTALGRGHGTVTVEAAEPMGGSAETVVYITESQRTVLDDRNGYEFEDPLTAVNALSTPAQWEREIQQFQAAHGLPKVRPGWVVWICVG